MVKAIEEICLRERIEVCEVADHAGSGVDPTAQGDLHGVVVTVSVGVIAFTEDGAVFGRIVGVRVETMGGAEMVKAVEIGLHGSP